MTKRMKRVKEILEESPKMGEFVDKVIHENLVISKSEARRLYFQVRSVDLDPEIGKIVRDNFFDMIKKD